MHETAVIEALLEQVRRCVPAGCTLRRVWVQVGRLEHLDGEVMQTAWSAGTAGTSLADSTLSISRVPVRIRCRACANVYEPRDLAFLLCPNCKQARPEILKGGGVLLRRIEVDQPAEVEATDGDSSCSKRVKAQR